MNFGNFLGAANKARQLHRQVVTWRHCDRGAGGTGDRRWRAITGAQLFIERPCLRRWFDIEIAFQRFNYTAIAFCHTRHIT